MLADGYFSAPHPKSTGKGRLQPGVAGGSHGKNRYAAYRDEDIQATLLELAAASIAGAILECAPETDEILTCGGGIHNLGTHARACNTLLPAIAVKSTADYGVDPDAVEALTFAWLAATTSGKHIGKPASGYRRKRNPSFSAQSTNRRCRNE